MEKGIVCKLWNIQTSSASSYKTAKAHIGDSLKYVLNDEKTSAKLDIGDNAFFEVEGQLERECQYVENDVKTAHGAYVGAHNLAYTDINSAIEQMMNVKKFWNKTEKRAALHGVISLDDFDTNSKDAISRLYMLCGDMLKEIFPDHQAIFAIHTNTKHVHVHFIVNSVGLHGKKIHQDKAFVPVKLHGCLNKLAEQYGFNKNEKWEKELEGCSTFIDMKVECRKLIDRAIEESETFDDFVEALRRKNVKVNVGKHISIKTGDMEKAIRTHRLGANYTKDAIVERLLDKKRALADVSVSNLVPNWHKVDDLYNFELSPMKKYADMDPDQRTYALTQLRLGNNPWRTHNKLNWQLNRMADEMNLDHRAQKYIKFLSPNGSPQEALNEIVRRKKQIAADKKEMKEIMKRYQPMIAAYKELKALEKEAYMFDRDGRREYRDLFEQYIKMTKRLTEGYGHNVFEIDAFLKGYDARIKFANGQLKELSEEYRDIQKYAKAHGYIAQEKISLSDYIDLNSQYDDTRNKTFGIETFCLISHGSDVIVRVR